MKSKTTLLFFINAFNKYYLFVILLFTMSIVSSQTPIVTSVSPTRVTQGSVITITGENFTNSVADGIRIRSNDIGTGSRKRISSTIMTFEINTNLNEDRIGTLHLNGGSTDTGFVIELIDPKDKISSIYDGTNRNNVTRITEIFTDWDFDGDGTKFWRSNDWVSGNLSTYPNDSHNLLGFTFNGITYSTGIVDQGTSVVDKRLSDNIGSSFTAKRFKAYSTNGVQGKINNNHYLIVGDKLNGHLDVNGTEPLNFPKPGPIEDFSIFESIVDGENGLDLGTGITNFNNDVTVKFFSGNGNVGAIGDGVPDLIITQIADAGDSSKDIYYYADVDGNVVGRPIALNIRKDGNNSNSNFLASWRMDLFTFQNNLSFQAAVPVNCRTDHTDIKTLKMVGLELDDFEIVANLDETDPDYLTHPDYPNQIRLINNINMGAGGNADIAFLAYNTDAFDIKSPVATRYPVSQFICRFSGTTSTFNFDARAIIDGGASANPTPANGNLKIQMV